MSERISKNQWAPGPFHSFFLGGIFVAVVLGFFKGSIKGKAIKPEKSIVNIFNKKVVKTKKGFVDSFGIEFLLVKAGEFKMGATGFSKDESPIHQVKINESFYLGKYEVTQEQWKKIMGSDTWANTVEAHKWRNRFAIRYGPKRPVVYVSYQDVIGFIQRMNSLSKGKISYRLPTEAEWEYAARAGTETAYSFGDDAKELPKYGWYVDNAYSIGNNEPDYGIHPVGIKWANPWGFFDIHGNVSEWVQDYYDRDYYKFSPMISPLGPEMGTKRVYRGGSWYDQMVTNVRSAKRFSETPDTRTSWIGFRLVAQMME